MTFIRAWLMANYYLLTWRNYSGGHHAVEGLASETEGPGSSLETTDILTESCGQANNALVSIFANVQ